MIYFSILVKKKLFLHNVGNVVRAQHKKKKTNKDVIICTTFKL